MRSLLLVAVALTLSACTRSITASSTCEIDVATSTLIALPDDSIAHDFQPRDRSLHENRLPYVLLASGELFKWSARERTYCIVRPVSQ
jgi:hypothetical protein